MGISGGDGKDAVHAGELNEEPVVGFEVTFGVRFAGYGAHTIRFANAVGGVDGVAKAYFGDDADIAIGGGAPFNFEVEGHFAAIWGGGH